MAKKIFSTINKDPAKLAFVSKYGINIYPLPEAELYNRQGKSIYTANSKNWYVEVDNNGRIKTFPKAVLASELQDAIWKTIIHYYNLLKDKK
ncbi:hypothetical protein [Flavobacterium phage FL-1]|nr:hypothetical protein [Flavobacterium phage FL-1]